MNVQVAPIETEIMEPLTLEDRALLVSCEEKVEFARNRAEEAIREAGEALFIISEKKLYRAEHRTFESYLRAKWSISPQRAYQLIDARNTFRLLVNTVDIPNEAVAREFAGLSDVEKIKVGKKLAKRGKQVTAKAARKAAAEVSPKKAAAEEKRQKKAEAQAVKITAKAAAKREKAEKKAFAKSEKTRIARENREEKEKENAKTKGKRAKDGAAKDVAHVTPPQRPARGGFTPSESGAKPKLLPGLMVEIWWNENRAQLTSYPAITPDALVKKIVGLFK